MNYHQLKASFLAELHTQVSDKIGSAQQLIDFTIESKTSATKGSAGDKHETGRAMMERELTLAKSQLNKAEFQQNELSKISSSLIYKKVEFGALVITSGAVYFMSIGLGRVSIDLSTSKQLREGFESIPFYAISCSSPIGMTLLNAVKGDTVVFRGNNIEILGIQ